MKTTRKLINLFFDNWPFYKKYGFFSLTPLFFIIGAVYEFTLIHLKIGEINFYDVYKRKEMEKIINKYEILLGKDV